MKSGITSDSTRIGCRSWVSNSRTGLLLAAMLLAMSSAQSADPPAAAPTSRPLLDADAARRAGELCERGAAALLKMQESDGGWASKTGPGVSSLAVWALARTPSVGPQHPAVQRGAAFVLGFQRDDGGLYSPEGLLKNYESSVALSMLAALRDPAYTPAIERLQQFLSAHQWDETESISTDNAWYGGAGYGYGKRPDLSNTQLMLDALRDSGLPRSDPAYRKALVFVQRCQMLGESNDQSFAGGSTQGGFIYTCAEGGQSKAGDREVDGKRELRAYGSMTYAGLKSMLYAGLSRDDPRVKAAVSWIRRYWTLEANPNMPASQAKQGLYYYYHTLSRALAAYGDEVIVEASGRERVWRSELVKQLARLQRDDGSWVNDADRWFEGLPELTTAYSLLALAEAGGR